MKFGETLQRNVESVFLKTYVLDKSQLYVDTGHVTTHLSDVTKTSRPLDGWAYRCAVRVGLSWCDVG